MLLFLIGSSVYATSSDIKNNLTSGPEIVSIEIKGLSRTKEYVIRRELLFKEGDVLTTEALLESIQEVKNLRIFSFVRPFLELQPGNKVKLIIELSEKWSTIPFMSYSQGGGTRYFYFGAYDINSFGNYIETGFRYENWDGEHGGVIWFRNPRFLNKRITIGADFWGTQRPTFLYNTEGDDQGDFVLQQQQFNAQLKKELNKLFELGVLLEYSKDIFHSVSTTNNIDAHTDMLLNTRDKSTTLLNTLTLKLGKLNYDIDVISGWRSDMLLSHSNDNLVSDYTFNKFKWKTQAYWQLPWRSYIASNLTIAATDTPLLQQYYNVGGFEHIRGYLTGQFRNRSYWQLNMEYRIPSYRSKWIILQHIFFADAANTADSPKDLDQFSENIYSAGIGIRLISPKVYSFNGRMDFALITSDESQISLSFGTQHFF